MPFWSEELGQWGFHYYENYSPGEWLGISRMYILKCEAFDAESSARHSNKCCVGDCHVTGSLIPVTPYSLEATLENRSLDWTMGIQAMVCCGRFEFVRSLSREWWVRKGVEVGLWDRTKAQSLMHSGSWHRSYDTPRSSGAQVASAKRAATKSNKCPGCGSKWSADVCDNCGYGMSI